MSKWFEPELRNDFDFIFSKIEDGEKFGIKHMFTPMNMHLNMIKEFFKKNRITLDI